MAYDQGLAQVLRDALDGRTISEKKMFGGLAFLMNGHMLCGVHTGGAMFRVGKDYYAAALATPGVQPLMFTGKPMMGMVDVSDDTIVDDSRLMAVALATVSQLPPKVAKRQKG